MAFVKSSKRLLIKKQEMVLIKASQEVQNTEIYGNLYDCLESYDKISEEDLDKNVVFDDKARIVLINPSNRNQMMEKIKQEWYSMKNFEISDSKINCQLCGCVNRRIFYIKNRHTDIELHIGSDCVKNYSDITGIKQQQKSLNKQLREQKMQQRKIEFEAMEGKEVTYISDAENRFKNFPVLLPFTLHERMKEVLQQINLTKTSYIKSGGDLNEIFQKYIILKKEFEELYGQAKNHYECVKDNLLVCDKSTSDWLKENNPQLWKMVAKNNGIFDNETLKRVYDDEFINMKLEEIKRHINDNDIKIVKVEKNSIRFLIQNKRYIYPITFSMPIKKFMETIGCHCLTNKGYRFGKANLQDINIEERTKNFDALYNSVSDILKENGYDFIIEEKTEQAYWVKGAYYARKNKWSNHSNQMAALYKPSSIKLFLSTLSPFLLQDESFLRQHFQFIVKHMEKGNAWLTQSEKKEREEDLKFARGLQKQRQFLPY